MKYIKLSKPYRGIKAGQVVYTSDPAVEGVEVSGFATAKKEAAPKPPTADSKGEEIKSETKSKKS